MATPTTTLTGETGTAYVFQFGTNALCRVEALTNTPIGLTFAELSNGVPRARLLRQFIQGTLIGGDAMTTDAIGDVIDDLGGLGTALTALGGALQRAVPLPDPVMDSAEVH